MTKHNAAAAASLIAGLVAAFATVAGHAHRTNLAPLPLDLQELGDGSFQDLDKMIES